MNVHLFGAVSSPSCPNYALQKAADDSETTVVWGKISSLMTVFFHKKRKCSPSMCSRRL